MSRTAPEAALACAALWTVHTVECAAYGRRNLSGPPTPDGEPSCADKVETAIIFEFAVALTERLHERAERLGLEPSEVEAGREYAVRTPWQRMVADYSQACRLVGGALSPA